MIRSSAKAIYGGEMAVHISPLTLRKRFNPYASNPADLHIAESLKADPRQKETFAAGWTFGSLRNLSKGGAQAVTLFQTIGNQGILSAQEAPYPVYDTLKGLAPYQGKSVKILESSDPHAVQAMMLENKILVMVNYTSTPQTVKLGDTQSHLNPSEIKFETLDRA